MSDHPVRRISRFVRNHPWAIELPKLQTICELLDMRMRGVTLTEQEVQARLGAAAQRRETVIVNAIAIIPLYGVLSQKMNMMSAISGGTSTEQFIAQVRAAIADQSVKGIVIDCDTPGGTVEGVPEAADALFALRERGGKSIVAVANPWIASAGYWIASQCHEVVSMASGSVGSVGIFCVHEDVSKMNEQMGVKPTYIFAGAYKVETMEDQPLSEDARNFVQSQVDTRYGDFVKAVARGRGVSVSTVKTEFGQGRMVLAKDALATHMIDRIETLDEAVSRLLADRGPRLMRASATSPMVAGVVPRNVSETLAPRDTAWSALTLGDFTDKTWDELTETEQRRIAGHFAWATEMPPATFGDLKLGHHRASDGAVVFRGVTAALGRLDSTDIPSADKPAVRSHLERHQAAFEKVEASHRSSVLAMAAAPTPLDPIIPNEDGECEDGYELGDDGMCHLVPAELEADQSTVQDAMAIVAATLMRS